MRTRLNQDISREGNEYNLAFDMALCNIELNKLSNVKKEDIEYLVHLSRKILESEWQRVKKEAQGKKMESEV